MRKQKYLIQMQMKQQIEINGESYSTNATLSGNPVTLIEQIGEQVVAKNEQGIVVVAYINELELTPIEHVYPIYFKTATVTGVIYSKSHTVSIMKYSGSTTIDTEKYVHGVSTNAFGKYLNEDCKIITRQQFEDELNEAKSFILTEADMMEKPRSMDELIECDDEPRDYKELTEQTRGL